ncbi:MAG: hypothetical protein IT438_01475 [Phycisphaerales bacterium]|nr:hypothetical protein [Phycisphaerales bacterium]
MTRTVIVFLAYVWCVAVATSRVQSAIVVESAPSSSSTTFTTVSGTYIDANGALHIPASALNSSNVKFRVYSDTGNPSTSTLPTEDLPKIVLDTGGSTGVNYILIIANAPTVGSQTAPYGQAAAGGVNWGGVQEGAYNFQLKGRVLGDLTGPIVVRNLVRLDVDGSMGSASFIEHTGPAGGPHLGHVQVGGSIASNAYVSATHGDVTTLHVLGDMAGHVFSNESNIKSVTVQGTLSGRVWAEKMIDTLSAGAISRWAGQVARGQSGFRARNDDVYAFRLHPDRNNNGIEDVWEVTQNPPISLDNNHNNIPDGCEVVYTVRPCDWNRSDIVSIQVLFDFLASYFAGNGEFNQSGTASMQDSFDFLACFFGLPSPCTRT